jgi:hypothetical protein
MKASLRYPLALLVVSLGLAIAAVFLFETGHVAHEHGLAGKAATAVALFVASGAVASAILPVVRRLAPRVFP